jgi:hypothetical protein
VEKTPAQMAAVERLKAWAVGPEGRARFRWGTEGSFDRCVRFYREKRVPERMVKGLCAELHHRATGRWPNEGKGDDD